MGHKHVFEAIDRSLRFVRSVDAFFGGLTVVFATDWRFLEHRLLSMLDLPGALVAPAPPMLTQPHLSRMIISHRHQDPVPALRAVVLPCT